MTDFSGFPSYQSHKVVRATPIVRTAIVETSIIRSLLKVDLFINPTNEAEEAFSPTEPAMAARAKVGDYAVVYEDGFRSISPKAAFEDGYTLIATPAA